MADLRALCTLQVELDPAILKHVAETSKQRAKSGEAYLSVECGYNEKWDCDIDVEFLMPLTPPKVAEQHPARLVSCPECNMFRVNLSDTPDERCWNCDRKMHDS